MTARKKPPVPTLSLRDWAEKIGVTRQQASLYLVAGRVPGARQADVDGQPMKVWRIPEDAPKPEPLKAGKKPRGTKP